MRSLITLTSILALSSSSLAQTPQFGGPMKHIMVGLSGNQLHAMVDPTVSTPIMHDYGDTYTGAAAVLNDTMYNAQYGWMIEGFWQAPDNATLWIEQTSATQGLMAFSGGTMMNPGTFVPIFSTGGSSARVSWDGRMRHNWYAAHMPGPYTATYRVYFGDAAGAELPEYPPAFVTLNWTAETEQPSDCDRADFDDNDSVDVTDLFTFLDAWFIDAGLVMPHMPTDIDGNGTVDMSDLFMYLDLWFTHSGQVC